jgi:hypothetical protein
VVPITATSEPGTGPAAATAKVTIAIGDLGLPGKLEIHLTALGRVSRDGTLLTAGRDYSFDADRRQLSLPLGRAGATTVVIEDAGSLFAEAREPEPAADAGVSPPRPGGGGGCAMVGGGTAGSPVAAALGLLAALGGLAVVTRRRRWPRRWRRTASSASSGCPSAG